MCRPPKNRPVFAFRLRHTECAYYFARFRGAKGDQLRHREPCLYVAVRAANVRLELLLASRFNVPASEA